MLDCLRPQLPGYGRFSGDVGMLKAIVGSLPLLLLYMQALAVPDTALAPTPKWVTADGLERRSCAAKTCGIIGRLDRGQQVTVLEEYAGWARITDYQRARCKGGRLTGVLAGNYGCDERNGIIDGQFAE
jgi:hypothetical protein